MFPIVVPALRERRGDIPRLAQHFALKASRKLGQPVDGVTPQFTEQAIGYDWPGNIRELENLVERSLIMGGAADVFSRVLDKVKHRRSAISRSSSSSARTSGASWKRRAG